MATVSQPGRDSQPRKDNSYSQVRTLLSTSLSFCLPQTHWKSWALKKEGERHLRT